MSEQSKDLSDPNFAAEAPNSEMLAAAAGPVEVPPPDFLAANLLAEALFAPEGLLAVPQASPRPGEERFEDIDPRMLQEALEESGGYRLLNQPQPNPLPPAPIQVVQKAHELMWYLLVKDQKRMILWFPDMVKDVMGSYKKWCKNILRRTSVILGRVFGLHLRLTNLHTMEFALVKSLGTEELERMALSNNHRMPLTGLLLMILSLIYVKGRGAREGAVWNVLRILGLRPWKKHPTFGDVKKIITEEFVELNYLKYQRVPYLEPPQYEFFWGPRANREITKMQIMEFLARVFKKEPQAWPSRYREALEQARALREANLAAQFPRSSFSED